MSAVGRDWRGGLRAALAIARRDLVEFVRDRRTLFITLLLPVATYPILALSTALGVRTAAVEIEAERAPVPIVVVASGRDAAAFVDRVTAVGAGVTGAARQEWPASLRLDVVLPAEARRRVDAGEADLWIETRPGIIAILDGRGAVEIPVRWSDKRPLPRQVRSQFEAVMKAVAADARQRRLAAAGLPPDLLEPLTLAYPVPKPGEATGPPKPIAPVVAGGVLVLLAVLTLTGAFYPAIDAIAGEKERGTIETLLIAPCAARDIVFGKFLAVFTVTLATLVVNVLSICATGAVAGRFLPQGLSLGLPAGGLPIAVSVLAFVGLAALSAATCLAVTTAAKSGKEAQNTLTPVILLVSALAGTALLPGMRAGSPIAAVPFAGQVLVGRAAFDLADGAAGSLVTVLTGLAVTLASSCLLTGLLLGLTSLMLTDEDILFRGPDVAASGLARPGRRERPTVVEGVVPLVGGLAALWYAQGLTPDDLAVAIPLQQVLTVLGPLALAVWWQRVNLVRTFSLRWPWGLPLGAGTPASRVTALTASLGGAALVGAGMFGLGAAALLAVKGTSLSAEAEDLNRRLLDLMLERPNWLAWCLMAAVPAVCEELLFRGWVLAAFAGAGKPLRRLAVAVVAQAACFAVFHLLPERMPQTFALGLALGAMTVATHSILPAIVCHLVHNSLPLVLVMLAGGRAALAEAAESAGSINSFTGIPPWAVVVAAICTACGIVLLATGMRAARDADKPRNNDI
jgi:ABC-type Na+ efflux pump permease subunit/membrane protease YdiL (CAAX protease family)